MANNRNQSTIKATSVDKTTVRAAQPSDAYLHEAPSDIILYIKNQYLDEKSHAHLNATSSFFYLNDKDTLLKRKAKFIEPLFNAILLADKKAVENFLKRYPMLALAPATIKIYGIEFTLSPYQLAIRLCDFSLHQNGQAEMVELFENLLQRRNELLAAQFNEIFPDNYKLYDDARAKSDLKELLAIFKVFEDSTDESVQQEALLQFHQYLQLSCATSVGKLFNHQLLIDAYKLYNEHIDPHSIDRNSPASQILFTIINFMPTCYLQAIVNPISGNHDRLLRYELFDRQRMPWLPDEEDELTKPLYLANCIRQQFQNVNKVVYKNKKNRETGVELILNNKDKAIETRAQKYAPKLDKHDESENQSNKFCIIQ